METRVFDRSERREVGRAARLAESLTSGFYCIPGREWPRFPYDINTLAEGPGQVNTIGIVTGAGAGEIQTAIELELDAFLTGEPAEHVMADAREGGIHFSAGGHYATEKAGVRRLGELLAERFGIEHEFIDVPNPI